MIYYLLQCNPWREVR